MIRIPKHESQDGISDLEKQIARRKNQFRELEDVLPHENGWKYFVFVVFKYVCNAALITLVYTILNQHVCNLASSY